MERTGNVQRETLNRIANELRKEGGAGVLCLRALERHVADGLSTEGLVISGLRSVGEALIIKQNGGTLFFVDAPVEVRFNRVKDRLRHGELPGTLDDFLRFEETESLGASESDQNVLGVRGVSDIIINNIDDASSLRRSVLSNLI